MELLNAILNMDPAQLFVAAAAICVMFAGGASSTPEDDNSDYDNASWNPASVNYND
jgi:hypothetical protein